MSITQALQIPGFMSQHELQWLADRAKSCKLIAELGSWRGRSTRALADNTTGLVYAVDTWKGSPEIAHELVGKPDSWLADEFRKNMSGCDNVQMLQMTTLEAAKELSDLRFDLIFIDADHSYENVKADIEAWRPLLAEGGLICGHDYCFLYKGVIRAVNELIPRGRILNTDAIWYEADKPFENRQPSTETSEQAILDYDYRDITLFISTPMYGGNCSSIFHQSILGLQKLCSQVGLRSAVSSTCGEALVTRARNYEVDKFRAVGMTHHLFIDGDIGFAPGDVMQMILVNKDIVVAPYAKKAINWKQVADAVRVGFPHEALDELATDLNFNTNDAVRMDGVPQRIREGGTGLMLVKGHVYDKMQAEYPEIEYLPMNDEKAEYNNGKYLYAFYDTSIDPETRNYLSEDWTFCRRWSRMGGEVFLLPWLRTAHYGNFIYVANAPAIAELHKQLIAEVAASTEKTLPRITPNTAIPEDLVDLAASYQAPVTAAACGGVSTSGRNTIKRKRIVD